MTQRGITTQSGSFELGEIKGKGSCGTVYRAKLIKPLRDLPIGADIAVKIIHPELLGAHTIIQRLKREVEIGIRVRSRNVVSIYGVERCEVFGQTTLAILMEYLQGQSLKQVLASKGPIAESLLIPITRQLANALRDIHALSIVHRDVKPANLILTPSRRVVLTDLGIARLPEVSTKVTTTGTFIGTCVYASPEQFLTQDELDPRSDLYSLGVVVYELATGVNPFRADNIVAVVNAHLHLEAPGPHEISPDISKHFGSIIMKLLRKEREDRIQTAQELLDLLESKSNPETQTTRITV